MDVDDDKITHGLAAKWAHVRWFDPYKPDPLAELSRLRNPPKGRGCLYPGATFNGTQKSGRNSYDVTVRIVNVDLEASHLCGYLNIRGLTEDWPELTTYFDAEIIGDRYGFVTGKWGATEADDLKHWARFPPFRPLRSALSKPGLRFNHLNKPFVFMRWKEKFLVPDHRVRDINGASFAGFYYVCVELGESAGIHRSDDSSPDTSPTLSSPTLAPAVSGPQWYAARTQRRRELSLSSPSGSTPYHPIYHPHSPLPPSGPGFWPASPTIPLSSAGTEDPFASMWPADAEMTDDLGAAGKMSGFYFHENSEPYQQLSLRHTAEWSSSSFEMR
ncbi:Vacuolar import/degradation protein Vid24 [Kalmanozyma brasiliensis GHG001]|uniref:Vacuolar import and degradation protein n=1 Tax=Kalmanozyma brasiliensis (strain GHG001) TaxID=1365824 RepID=V5GVA7_KALBG|nr:Vacuolar import/degradation protein Vid24 [Kalmanozyma brasiliensis GHG001]EST09837.1 Vacuolar import/degradation protein Vid24 [Kalmanozyma brasiliensis GHG001]